MVFGSIAAIVIGSNINIRPSYSKDLSWWDNNCVLPDGYTSISDIVASGSSTTYTTRGTITSIEGNYMFIQSQGVGLRVDSSSSLNSYSVGNVVDVTGKRNLYYKLVRLQSATVSLYSETNPTPVVPVITTAADCLKNIPADGRAVYAKVTDIEYSLDQSGGTVKFDNCGNGVMAGCEVSVIRSYIENELFEYSGSLCFTGIVSTYNSTQQLRITGTDCLTMEYTSNIPVTSISVSPNNEHIFAGESLQMSATVLPLNATSRRLNWSTTSGASINNDGLFTSSTPGTYTVTATAIDGSGVYGTAQVVVDELTYGYVIENPQQNGDILGPLYVPGSLDKPSVSYLEMIKEYGDAILFDFGDFEMLIDGGNTEDMSNVMAAVNNACEDHELELLVTTHAHADHIGGIRYKTNFENYGGLTSIKYIVDSGCTYTTSTYKTYESMRNAYVAQGTTYFSIYEMINNSTSNYPNEFLICDGVTLKFLDTGSYLPYNEPVGEDINETSVSALLSIGNTRYFLCGDITNSTSSGSIENFIINTYGNTGLWSEDTYNVVKANHHCSGTHGSNSDAWVAGTMPDVVVISASIISDNRTSSGVTTKQHPNNNSLNRYVSYTDKVYCNMINGTITLTHNSINSTPTMSFAGRTIDYYDNGVIVSRTAEKNLRFVDSAFYSKSKNLK